MRCSRYVRRLAGPVLVLILFFVTGVQAHAQSTLRVGVGKRVITPDLSQHGPVYLAGFGRNRLATGIHDDLYARCFALADRRNTVVLCGVDSIGLFLEDTDRIRALVARSAGARPKVVVTVTHVHEAPDTMGLWGPALNKTGIVEAYNQFVIKQTAAAALDAIRTLAPARFRLATVRSPELVSFLADTRPPVVHDDAVIALSATTTAGKPIGTLLNWANHPEAVGSRNTLVTADYAGYLYKRYEELQGGVAVLINGALGGMQSPLGARITDPRSGKVITEAGFEAAEVVGLRTAEITAEAIRQSKPVTLSGIYYAEKEVDVPVTNPNFLMASKAGLFAGRRSFREDGGIHTRVAYLRLSSPSGPQLEAAMAPGELYPELSVGGAERYEGADFPDAPIETPIKTMFSAPHRMLFGLAFDELGYIIPKCEWDHVKPWLQNSPKEWYGEINAVGPDIAPVLVNAIESLAKGAK